VTGEHLSPRRGTWCGTQLNTKRAHSIPSTVVCVSREKLANPAGTLSRDLRPAPEPRSRDGPLPRASWWTHAQPASLCVSIQPIDVQGDYTRSDTRFLCD